MTAESGRAGRDEGPSEELIRELIGQLGTSFELSTPIGERSLGEAVEHRLRSLKLGVAPEWGSDGAVSQVAKKESGALDFYYRPHLFPEMEPALRLGHQLQFDLLPRHLPAGSPLRVAAVLESYCHLSGDLLGWRLEGDELFLWIADVSGHGVRAGLAAATLYFLIDGIEHGLDPAAFAQQMNERMLAARNPEDLSALFATAFWLRVGTDGQVLYASSGHDPMLLRRESGTVESLAATGRPLGLLPHQTFEQRALQLEEEDLLCLFTDGVVEAKSPGEEEFGSDRLASLLGAGRQAPMETAHAIHRAVRDHQTTSLLDDDLTFMVIERRAAAD
jgi:sigma-B regulation protein RsbU (phosphoserine phosphatase)